MDELVDALVTELLGCFMRPGDEPTGDQLRAMGRFRQRLDQLVAALSGNDPPGFGSYRNRPTIEQLAKTALFRVMKTSRPNGVTTGHAACV